MIGINKVAKINNPGEEKIINFSSFGKSMGKDFLSDLNEAQQKAVVDFEGPSLVIAGAGSGKTRVLTYRIAYLLSQGIRPGNILALTFTNKAAREMKERIGNLVGPDLARRLWMGTFHSIFARILRNEGSLLGYPSRFTIYDSSDSRSLVKKIIKEMDLNDQIYKPGEIHARISSAKNNLITPASYFSSAQLMEIDKRTRRPRIADIYKLYAQRCKKADAMDFDDLLLNMHILLRDFPDVLGKYQELFRYILVDEYQDTNYVQYLIAKQLSAKFRNLCVVGDDAQSIYSFRGARIENILNFKHDYPGYRLYKLERNYRSTRNIVDAANSIIARNQDQISKKIFSKKEKGEKIRLVRAATDHEEGYLVAGAIQDAIYGQQIRHRDIAILYRTNAQSRIFEESLRRMNIPYKVYGSLSFYQRKEIKDLLAYFRLTVNPHDEEALRRIINYPARGIGQTTLTKLEEEAARGDARIWDLLQDNGSLLQLFNQGTIRKLEAFRSMISRFQSGLGTMEAFDLAFLIAESSGILKDLHYEDSPENLSKYENIQELLNGIREFMESQEEAGQTTLDAFLQNVSLLTDADTEKEEDRDKVTIMTAHSAKGLEFKFVYITGLEEDLFPSRMSSSTREELEEERRLFYVALTRAMQRVTLSYAGSRYRWGVPVNGVPSRFIREIDPEYLDQPLTAGSATNLSPAYDPDAGSTGWRAGTGKTFYRGEGREKTRPGPVEPAAGRLQGKTRVERARPAMPEDDFKADDPAEIQPGMEVEHPRFGTGKVLNLEGPGANRKATVFFREHGQKQLLLKFARLKIIR
jgi:DNA helicase-2/ATP-dependent DNA helicase PcrA